MKKLFTTESVTKGHPDKVSDQIADAILDAYLKEDKNARVACEVCVSSKKVLVMGEITSTKTPDLESVVRETIIGIGYDNDELGFNGYNIPIEFALNKQSTDIARGVSKEDIGAGDQGMMYGYACDETDEFMPLTHVLAVNLTKKMDEARVSGLIKGVCPDGKAQLTLEYDDDSVRVDTIIISWQHKKEKDLEELKQEIKKKIIDKVVPSKLMDKDIKIYINPTGRFVIGGPLGDSGLTGRKIMVDSYGGLAHHGGGAFSGKDYTKTDRSAAYYARYVAKHIVASNLAKKCEISVSYAIGLSKPIAVTIDTFNTNTISEEEILNIINEYFDFSPSNIISELDLKNVKYSDTTMYSHFGKSNLPWEKLNKVSAIRKKLKNY